MSDPLDKLFLPRDPTAPVRTRRALDGISNVLNSLIRRGGIVRVGPADWDVGDAAGSSTFTAENKDGGSLPPGAVVAVHSSGVGVVRAKAADATLPAAGFVRVGGAAGVAVGVDTDGLLQLADWSGVTDEAAAELAAHAVYYVSPSNAGQITSTAPTTAGQVVQRVGRAVAPDTLDIEIDRSILL